MVSDADALCSWLTGSFRGAVKCEVKARKVTISGKRGKVTKDFSHIACEIKKMKQVKKKGGNSKREGLFIRLRIWFGGKQQACAVNTVKSHIRNMIKGVTEVSVGATAISFRPRTCVCDRCGGSACLDFNY